MSNPERSEAIPPMQVNVAGELIPVDPASTDMVFVNLGSQVGICIDLGYLDPAMGTEWRTMPEPFVQIRLTDDGFASDQVVLAEIPLRVLQRTEPGDRAWYEPPAGWG